MDRQWRSWQHRLGSSPQVCSITLIYLWQSWFPLSLEHHTSYLRCGRNDRQLASSEWSYMVSVAKNVCDPSCRPWGCQERYQEQGRFCVCAWTSVSMHTCNKMPQQRGESGWMHIFSLLGPSVSIHIYINTWIHQYINTCVHNAAC